MIPRTAATAAAAFALLAAVSAAAAAPAPASTTLTLAQAEDIALASSPALALARGQLDLAHAGVGLARSGELPDLAVNGSGTRFKSTTTTQGQTFTALGTSKSASLALNQLLVDGGRVHDQVRAAELGSDAAQLALARQVENVEFGVAQAYYAALQARHQLQVARDSLRLAQVQERLVEAQYRAGVASKADVLTAQLPVAQAELAVAQDVNGEQTQLALMLNTMGVSAQTPVTITDETASPQSLPPVDDVMAVAVRRRPDLLAAQASADSAVASLRAARLGLFPTISANGSAGTSATKIDAVPGSGTYNPSWSAGVALTIPLFDGGLTRAQTASAQAQADVAQAGLKAAQLLVSLNVQQAFLGVETAQAGLTAANAEYAQAKTVLDVTNAQYRAGVTTLPLLLNAQVGLAKAEGDQVNALYAYKTAWQQLLLSEGTIGK